jgi:hypothetical protein
MGDSTKAAGGPGANARSETGVGARDTINQPPHYTHASIEPIDVIESWRLNFHLGNVVKYVARAEHKGTQLDDLRKGRWYLDREIARLEREIQRLTDEGKR